MLLMLVCDAFGRGEVVPGTSRHSPVGGGPLAASPLRKLMTEGVLVMLGNYTFNFTQKFTKLYHSRVI